MMKNKKGITWLLNMAYVIVALVILVGIGIAVSDKLGNTVGGSSNTSIQYGITQLGSAGLLSYLPLVIILVIGMFFLSYFMGSKKGY